MAGYFGSGHVSHTGGAPGNQYENLSCGDFGVAVTCAGFSVGGHAMVGALWGDYLYGTRHQGEFDFQTSAVGTAFNNVKSQAIDIGTIVKW
jgi:hypothetical protein